MLIRLITGLLMLFVVFMGTKQGIAVFRGKAESIAIFEKAGIPSVWLSVFGMVTLLSAALIIFPRTFPAGNILMAMTILMLIGLQLYIKAPRAALIEVPFLGLNLLLLYLGYPVRF